MPRVGDDHAQQEEIAVPSAVRQATTFETEPPALVRLNGQRPVARGRENEIFARPDKPSQLVKVARSDWLERARTSPLKTLWRRWRGIGTYTYRNIYRRERAYFDAMVRAAEIGRPPPLAHPRGMILTDRGLGVVVQKIRTRDGGVAPTLKRLHREGRLDAELVGALTRFASDLRTFRIVTHDLAPSNIVHETRHGRSRLVLVDGYGSYTLIPLRRWSRRANDRSLSRRLKRLAGRLDLRWDEDGWRFIA
jgi:hypothetical protein